MKKTLLLILTLFSINSYASCEKNLASNFDFKYEIKDEQLNIQIESKDKRDFSIYQYYNNIDLFFNFIDKVKPIEENNKFGIFFSVVADENTEINFERLKNYFSDFSFALKFTQNTTYGIPLKEEDKKTLKQYTETADLKKLIYWLRDYYPEDNKYGVQKVIFKIKLIADPEIKSCIVFETKPVEIDFGNKYLIWLNKEYNFYKEKKYYKLN